MSIIILSLSLGLVFYTIEIAKGKIQLLRYLILFSLMIIGVGWIGVRNSYVVWSLRILVVTLLLYVVFNLQAKQNLLKIPKKMIYVLSLGCVTSFIPSKQIFYLFAAGYDNSSHVGFLFRTWKIGSFEYGMEGNGKNLPAYINLANGYPSLQMETWASVLHILNLQIDNTEQLLRYFFFFSILSILLLIYTLFTYSSQKHKSNVLIKNSIALFVLFSSISTIFWSGFPPTIWGIIVNLIGIRVLIEANFEAKSQLIWSAFTFIASLYAYQLFSFSLLAIYAFLFARIFLTNSISKIYLTAFLSLFIIVIPGYLLFNVSKEIKNYIYAQGGIVLPNTSLLLFLTVFVLIGFVNSKKRLAEEFLLVVALSTSTILSTYLLASAFLRDKGVYYPAKLLYLTIFLMISYLLWVIDKPQGELRFKKLNLLPLTAAILIIFTVLPLTSKSKEIWFGSSLHLLRSVNVLKLGDFAPFNPGCLNSVFNRAITAENFNQQSNLIVVKTDGSQSDLISRWANSLNGRVDNNVIEFGMSLSPVSSFDMSVQNFTKKYPKENLVVLDDLPGCTSIS